MSTNQHTSKSRPRATPHDIDDADNLTRHLAQADAMATIITAEGMECFDQWNQRTREEYLWALSDKIREARAVASKL